MPFFSDVSDYNRLYEAKLIKTLKKFTAKPITQVRRRGGVEMRREEEGREEWAMGLCMHLLTAVQNYGSVITIIILSKYYS